MNTPRKPSSSACRRKVRVSSSDSSEGEEQPWPSPLPGLLSTSFTHLSPRRSARLLEKHGALQKTEVLSDYGTLSVMSASQDLASVLSDDVSNLSIDDAFNNTSPTSTDTVQLLEKNGVYVLVPFKLHYNFRNLAKPRTSLLKLDLEIFQDEEGAASELFNIFESCLQKVKISWNEGEMGEGLKPLICVPFPYGFDFVYIFSEDGGRLRLLEKTRVKNDYVSFYPESPGVVMLVPRRNPLVVRNTLKPDEELVLKVDDPVEIQVTFPKNTCSYPLMAELQVHVDNYLEYGFGDGAPAAPVICLSPSSVSFLHPVKIRIEILDYEAIRRSLPDVGLKVFQCCDTKVTELVYDVVQVGEKYFVEFSVSGFSFFRTFWTTVMERLISAELGLARVLRNKAQTRMRCLATMNEYESNQFCLEVSVFKAEKLAPDYQAFAHKVGKSSIKLVRHGPLEVVLKSELLEANADAGEDPKLSKIEEFYGEDFSSQFSLKFKEPLTQGPFGKILVKQSGNIVFEFTLQKQGNETEVPNETSEFLGFFGRWSIVTLNDLATNLSITDGGNWKFLVQKLFTENEIQRRYSFKTSPDPFKAILNAYREHGGTPEELIGFLYFTHREIISAQRIGGGHAEALSRPDMSDALSGLRRSYSTGSESMSQGQLESESSSDDERMFVDDRGSSHSSLSRTPNSTSPMDDPSRTGRGTKRPPKSTPSRKKLKRQRKSTHSSSSDDSIRHEESSTNPDLTSSTYLMSENELWKFTSHLTVSGWKALGRTLELDESTLITIEQQHKEGGNRECYYQVLLAWKEMYPQRCRVGVLYNALKQQNMVGIANKLVMFCNQT